MLCSTRSMPELVEAALQAGAESAPRPPVEVDLDGVGAGGVGHVV